MDEKKESLNEEDCGESKLRPKSKSNTQRLFWLIFFALVIYLIVSRLGLSVLANIFVVLLGISAVIIVHELGHFFTAKLTGMKVEDFADILSTDAPAPGGGSVAALCGALSGSLSSMVSALTHGKNGYEEVFFPGEIEYRTLERRLQEGIPVDDMFWQPILDTAKELGVDLEKAMG